MFEYLIQAYARALSGVGLCIVLYAYFFLYRKFQAWPFLEYLALFDRYKESFNSAYESIRVPKSWFTYFYAIGVPVVGCLTVLEMFSSTPNMTIICLFTVYWLHLIRRLYECLFISVFSDAKMSLSHFLLGMTFYIESPASIYISRHLSANRSLFEIGLFLLTTSLIQALQHTTFVQLASLRQEKKTDDYSSGKVDKSGSS